MFYLFAGDHYYPMSGLGDYRGKFDTQEEAVAVGEKLVAPRQGNDWYTVITVDQYDDLREVANGYRDRNRD